MSRATDIFAASIVLWELLSQRRLFKARTVAATAQSVMTKIVLPSSTYCPKLSKKVDAVVLRGLERDWKKRWRSANEFAFALERSTRVASHREVIQWLKQLGKDELLRRATLVRDMELTPVNADRVDLLRRTVTLTAEPTPTMAAHAMGEEVGPSPSSPRGPLESSPGELVAHARESSPASSPVSRGPYGANMVPDARVSDRTFTRDATNGEMTGSTVRELARRPLSSGLAAVLFAFCTLLIVFSVWWQRTSELGEGGSVRPGSYGPREVARQPRSGNGNRVHSEALNLARPEKVVVMAGVAAVSAMSVASVAPPTDVLVTPPRRAAEHQGGKARSRSVARRMNARDRTKSRPTITKSTGRRSKRKVKPMPWAY